MINAVNGYEIRDKDSLQCGKKTGERKYKYIQAIWLDTPGTKEHHYVVVADEYNLNDFTEEDCELAITGFYESLEILKQKYDYDPVCIDELVSECAFENEQTYSEESAECTWGEAEQIIQQFMYDETLYPEVKL